MKVFLGGTCGKFDWRRDIIHVLNESGIEYYDPYIRTGKRTSDNELEEIRAREDCDMVLYCITHEMRGVYSIAEAVDDSNKKNGRVLYYFYPETEDNKYALKGVLHSLEEVGRMVRRNGSRWFETYDELIEFFRTCEVHNDEVVSLDKMLAYTE